MLRIYNSSACLNQFLTRCSRPVTVNVNKFSIILRVDDIPCHRYRTRKYYSQLLSHFSSKFEVDRQQVVSISLSCKFATSVETEMAIPIATYEEVKDLPNHPEVLLVDVREPEELAETGQIPTSINIPLKKVEESLKLDSEAFKTAYGRDKPAVDQEIIFHCKMGGRAGKAAEAAKALGFLNVKNYKGSWMEWAEKNGLKQ